MLWQICAIRKIESVFGNKGDSMFLMDKKNYDLLEVMALEDMYDPCKSNITARSHSGEEMQDPETFLKSELMFPSGEPLPRCWVDAHYQHACA
ncbi:MAG: acetyltransferase [Oscillatoria princeps RMCB-10]|jgi:hypothetical protein|nr:acetyltransferase [Oscillatoria princeps RMCB-10]